MTLTAKEWGMLNYEYTATDQRIYTNQYATVTMRGTYNNLVIMIKPDGPIFHKTDSDGFCHCDVGEQAPDDDFLEEFQVERTYIKPYRWL
jgi:hypothetical protein